ncbi:MAG: hypothetical protein V4689_10865 [Verrucomicrobiota bacterium]
MNHLSRTTLSASLVLTAAAGTTFGGSPETPVVETPPAAFAPGWEFRASPYGWLTGLDGDTGIGSLNTHVDDSFSDIAQHLKFAAAIQFEARKDRWGIIADGFYACLGDSGNPPGSIYNHVGADLKEFLGELSVAYRVYESPSGFVDVYAGARYNYLGLDLHGSLNPVGIQTASTAASDRVVTGLTDRAEEIVQPKINDYQAASATRRASIEAKITADIKAEADDRVKEDLKRELVRLRREGGLSARDIVDARISAAVKVERVKLAAAAASLEVAKLRASVDSSLKGKVTRAEARVTQAKQNLSAALNQQVIADSPTSASASESWVDPIIGVRAQWNITPKWYLAAKTDIGGFSVGSDLAWTFQGTVGYQFTEKVSADLGYRYLHTDYSDGAFTYDMATAGLYTGLNIRF